jgi:GT2 family glycosyltransferase
MKIEILVVSSRFEYLQKCVESALCRKNSMTVVVDGYCRESAAYLKDLSEKNTGIKYYVIEQKAGKSAARNLGIRKIKADAVYFLDDDAFFEGDNVSLMERLFLENPDVAVIGGPNLTPLDSGYFQRVSGYVFSSLLGAWKMAGRYKRTERRFCDDKSLILCNLAVRLDSIENEGVCFNETLKYNEENLLLEGLKKKGAKMLYEPDLVVFHARRKTLAGFAVQIFGSGHGRAQMSFEMPDSLRFYHTIPALFLFYLTAIPLAVLARDRAIDITGLLPLGIYLLACFVNAVFVLSRSGESLAAVPALMLLTLTAHVSYGAGFVCGILYSGFIRLERLIGYNDKIEYEKP